MSAVAHVPLGEIAAIIAGQSPPGHSYNEAADGLPFFQGKADFGDVHPVARKWCTEPKKIAESGDILISVRAPVGPTNIAKERCCIGRGLAAIRPDNEIMCRDFVHWAIIHRHDEIVAKGRGSIFASIDKSDLSSISIPLMPRKKQEQIADILNSASHIRRLCRRAYGCLRNLVPPLFVKMFGDPVENPIGWPISTIGETCTVIGGGTPRRIHDEYFGGDIIWATPTDVTALKGFYIRETKENITEKGLQKSSARIVPADSVLMTSRATIGYTAIAKAPMATNQGFANLICGDSLLPEYLSFFLRNRADALIDMANGTTFKEISKSTLKTVRIPLPPMDLQRRFSVIARKTSRSIAAAEAAAGAASALTDALAARLLEQAP